MARTDSGLPGLRVLVGGVGQLYQGDLDFARIVLERMAQEELGADVLVEDLSYGAVAVAQRLEELRPIALLLVGAASRGRAPGTLACRALRPLVLGPDEVRQAIAEAVTGYVSIDLLVEVASGLGALPERTVAIELEPAAVEVSDRLSSAAETAVDEAVALVRDELAELQSLADGPS